MDSENNIYDIDYIIVTGRDHDELENIVRRQIGKGYEPIGGIAIKVQKYRVEDNSYNTSYIKSDIDKFYQSMIRKTRKEIIKEKKRI